MIYQFIYYRHKQAVQLDLENTMNIQLARY